MSCQFPVYVRYVITTQHQQSVAMTTVLLMTSLLRQSRSSVTPYTVVLQTKTYLSIQIAYWLVVTEVRSFGLVTERRHYNARPIYMYMSGFCVVQVLFFIVQCCIARFPCAMRVFDVQASSSSPRLPLCQISFFGGLHCWASNGEKSRRPTQSITQSLTHSPSLLDAPGTEAFASENLSHDRLTHTSINRTTLRSFWLLSGLPCLTLFCFSFYLFLCLLTSCERQSCLLGGIKTHIKYY